MEMQMEIQVMEILVRDLSKFKHLVIMGLLREMALMVGKLVMVMGMAMLSHDKPNNSNFDG